MTRQGWSTALALAVSVLGTSTWADGMRQPAAPPPCCNAPFAGAYLGLALGYGQQRVEIDNETLGTEFSDDDGGVTVGGYAGYNWQRCCSSFVLGVETDFNYLNSRPTALDIETGPTLLTETTSLKSRMDWFGTIRARAGYMVRDDWLLYATGGLAYAEIDHTLSDNCVGCGNTPFNLGPFTQSNKDTEVGFAVGGGTEFLRDSHWLLRAEGLFVDLGSETHTYVVTAPGIGTATAVAKWNDQFWVARLGVAYKFGEPECCAVPLK